VGGLLNTVQETTAKVQSERQIRMLGELAARAAQAKTEAQAYQIAAEVLSTNELDFPFALLYSVSDAGDCVQLAAASGWDGYGGPAKTAIVPLGEDVDAAGWPFAQALRAGREFVVDDLARRFGPLPLGRWNARPERAVVLPLSRAGQATPYALLVAGVSPHRVLDDRYRALFRATADEMAGVVAGARAYDAERQRAEALAEIDRAKTVFFSNISHEFRTPLTLILGLVEAAMTGAEGLCGEDLRVVHRNGVRLLRLVNSLLDFTRIEAGRLKLRFEPTDLAALTIELASGFYSLVERAGMRLVVDCPPLPEPVCVDRSQWEKIVLNLISNAFKFTFQGEIKVVLTWHGGHAELCVSDTGTGIPADELPHIFDRFHRVEQSRGRSFEGTGIGLSLVQDLVKLHGGGVQVSSVEGRGSRFTVSIPGGTAHLPADQILHTSDAAPSDVRASPYFIEASQWVPRSDGTVQPDGAAEVSTAPQRLSPPPSPVQSARILVVDDNADMREYLCRLLRARWDVEAAGDGQAALSSARARPPDLILSDVMMPRMDGFALLRALRADSRTRTVPVILLSARAGEEAVLEGLDHGADDYLAKPFTTQELLARVRTHLTMAHSRNALNRELAHANQELEAFSHSVAHDLRGPLRGIDGFSRLLLTEHSAAMDADARGYLERVLRATGTMGQMIDDLLMLSRVGRMQLRRCEVDLSSLARDVVEALRLREPERNVCVEIAPGLVAQGDAGLLRIALENLLGNAWKYTGRQATARIEVGTAPGEGGLVYFVRDNGAGFDMKYAGKLFNAFARLHSPSEFPGTGIGLATVRRIVDRHGGHIGVRAAVNEGATFYFSLQ
jgi:signal transduction histidine kinase